MKCNNCLRPCAVESCHFIFPAEEDYKNLVDKYSTIREDFNKKMEDSCRVSRTDEGVTEGLPPSFVSNDYAEIKYEPPHEKTNNLPRRKQRRRSASQ